MRGVGQRGLARSALSLALAPLPLAGGPLTEPPQAGSAASSPAATSASGPVAHATYVNPVFRRPFPDPAVLRVGNDYYAYATTSGRRRRNLFPILHSRDLVRWRPAGYAFRRPPRFSTGHWWAPSPLYWRGRYYLFYSAQARRPNRLCVAVAKAARPTGPFHHRARLACGGAGGSIDPAPLVLGDRVLLYFARTDGGCRRRPRRCSISVVRLRGDLLRARGRVVRVLGLSRRWERRGRRPVVENPWVVQRQGTYFLLYSAGDWTRNYGMGYAVSRSPFGPFGKPEPAPFLHARRGLGGPGGGSTVRGPRGDQWLVYHARRRSRRRLLHLDRIRLVGGRVRVDGPSLRPAAAP